MSLATRCTACGTIFRVVEDQLRVSEGWVRCGRCAEVFDAREQLFDIDLEAPPPWPPAPAHDTPAVDLSTQDDGRWAPSPPPTSSPPVPIPASAYAPPPPRPVDLTAAPPHKEPRPGHDSIVAAAMDSRHEPRWVDEPGLDAGGAKDPAPRWTEPEIEPSLEQQVAQEVEQEMARLSAQRAQLEAQAQAEADIQQQAYEEEQARLQAELAAAEASQRAQAQLAQLAQQKATPAPHSPGEGDHGFQPTTLGENGELLAAAEAEATKAVKPEGTAAGGESNSGGAPSELPTFMRPARQATIWNRLWVRVSLGLLCGLALAALGLQATWQFRDALVARYPQLRADLQAFCAVAHCEIKPWQRLDSFSVDASALSQAGSGHHYKLALTLRNKSEYELALPWVELSLTDANGQLIARRALAPKDFNLSQDALAAATELPVQALLTTGDKAVSGYSVELFYP
ncbi:DUF3426 domain-containing protein [Paucibacter sp. B51]|uniref:DUF3426 domain-containing protein n=1 Tax=Paucibacter sp. B51 TaxID=2993315 RepID=UPI0022EBF9A3|nr:DUF3426 domain-containing protein [Paucibacter sp. B51]